MKKSYFTRWQWLSLLLLAVSFLCSGEDSASAQESPNFQKLRSLPELNTEAEFTAFSTEGGGLSRAGRSLKFIIDNRNSSDKKICFINANYLSGGTIPDSAKFHFYFAQQHFGINDSAAYFNSTTYENNTKRFIAGNLQTYYLGDKQTLAYAIQFYPNDVISEAMILNALQALKEVIHIPNAQLVFIATGAQQSFETIKEEAKALNIQLLNIDQVLGSVKFIGLNTGEAWGILRIFPRDVDTLNPVDIPVFDELPLDLSVVAGTITRAYQDINSHVNLKSRERNTPNMVLRDAGPQNALLTAYANKPIHLKVGLNGFTIEATTAAIVKQKLNEKLNRPWIALPISDEKNLLSFDELCPKVSNKCFDKSAAMGGKTTGLAFLAGALGRVNGSGSLSNKYGFDLSPLGFGIPVKYYRDFVNSPENGLLKKKIDELVFKEKSGLLNAVERNKMATEIQSLFYSAKISPLLESEVRNRLKMVIPGVTKFKFRSSATSEDIANFNGAGLYDSFSIDSTKTDNENFSCAIDSESKGALTKLKLKPNTVQCGIKAVFASLWNSRAIVERTFARLDHASAGMGIAVNPSYGEESANAVLVTRVNGTDGIYGYSVSVQKGENLVTNPLPGTISEFDVIAFTDINKPTFVNTLRFAKPSSESPVLTQQVLPKSAMLQLVDIATAIEIAYCAAKPSYYPKRDCSFVWLDSEKPLSLDMEIKLKSDGHFQFKQLREYHGR